MSLTEKQKENIQKLSIDDCIEIIYECEERLGLVSQVSYCKIMNWTKSRETLDNYIRLGKIKSMKLCGRTLLIIND
jgi:hypothetical protein